jgi:transposase
MGVMRSPKGGEASKASRATIRHAVALEIVNRPGSTVREVAQRLKVGMLTVRKGLEFWREMNLAYNTREIGKGPSRRWSPEPPLVEIVRSGGAVTAREAFLAADSGVPNPWTHPYRGLRRPMMSSAGQAVPLDYSSPLLAAR